MGESIGCQIYRAMGRSVSMSRSMLCHSAEKREAFTASELEIEA